MLMSDLLSPPWFWKHHIILFPNLAKLICAEALVPFFSYNLLAEEWCDLLPFPEKRMMLPLGLSHVHLYLFELIESERGVFRKRDCE